MAKREVAVVAGVGPGLSAAVCRKLADAGYSVAGLARSREFGDTLVDEIAAAGGFMRLYPCDVTEETSVDAALGEIESSLAAPSVLIYTAGAFLMCPIADTLGRDFERLWRVNCLGAFNCTRRVLPGMLQNRHGTIILTGATASLKAGAQFAAFGASKFALRGLAQGMARELGPRGIHVAHVVVDGVIWMPRTSSISGVDESTTLAPDAIASSYLHLIEQDRSAWTLELDLRPDVEAF